MRKKFLVAAFAAMLMAGVAMGGEEKNFAHTPGGNGVGSGNLGNITAGTGAPIDWGTSGVTNNDLTAGGGIVNLSGSNTLSGISGSSAISGNPGTAGVNGHDVEYTVDALDALLGGSGKSLTINGGNGGNAGETGTNPPGTNPLNGGNAGHVLLSVNGKVGLNGATITLNRGTAGSPFTADNGIGSGGTRGQAGINFSNTSTLEMNAGAININSGTFVAMQSGAKFHGGASGTINVAGKLALGASYAMGNADTTAGTLADADAVTDLRMSWLFSTVALQNTGVFEINLANTVNLGTQALILQSGATNGKVNISGGGTTEFANDFDVDNSTLTFIGTGDNTFLGNISAGSLINGDAFNAPTSVYKGAVNADLQTFGDVTFIGSAAALNGDLILENNVKALIGGPNVGDAAQIVINSGQSLDTQGANIITLEGEGSSLSLLSGAQVDVGGLTDLNVGDKTALTVDANVKIGIASNLSPVIGTVNLTHADSVLNITNTSGIDSTHNLALKTAATNNGVVNLDMAGKKLGSLNALGAKVNVVGGVEMSAQLQTTATTADAVKFGNGVTASIGGTTSSGGGIMIGRNADVNFKNIVTTGNNEDFAIDNNAKVTFASVANNIQKLTAAGGSSIIAAGNAGPGITTLNGNNANDFVINKGAIIDSSNGSFKVQNYTSATIDGVIAMGYNTAGQAANTLDLTGQANATVSNKSTYTFTSDFVTNLDIDGTPNKTSTLIASNGTDFVYNGIRELNIFYGQFDIDYKDLATDPTYGGKVYISHVDNRLDGTGSLEDRLRAENNLEVMWAPEHADGPIDLSLANFAYDSVYPSPNGALTFTTDSFGVNAKELVDALVNHDTRLVNEGVIKSVFRNGQVGELLMGGFSEIRGINNAIGARVQQLRGQRVVADETYYEYANPTLILNNDYANRVWAGYLGNWEKGDRRHKVEGYKYDSNGFILGYDRLIGCNFAMGAAFSYTQADYTDKAAINDQTKVDNYSVNGYATYTANSGAFATLFGGYTHSETDLNARYNLSNSGVSNASYDSDYWNLGAQFGYDLQPIDNFIITPSLGVTYLHGKSKSHRNSLGTVDAATLKALLVPVEIAARYHFDFANCSRLTVEANVGYSYNFHKDGAGASMILAGVNNPDGTPVIIDGLKREQSRHTWNFGGGLRYHFNRFDVGVKYDYFLQQDTKAHRVMGSVGLNF